MIYGLFTRELLLQFPVLLILTTTLWAFGRGQRWRWGSVKDLRRQGFIIKLKNVQSILVFVKKFFWSCHRESVFFSSNALPRCMKWTTGLISQSRHATVHFPSCYNWLCAVGCSTARTKCVIIAMNFGTSYSFSPVKSPSDAFAVDFWTSANYTLPPSSSVFVFTLHRGFKSSHSGSVCFCWYCDRGHRLHDDTFITSANKVMFSVQFVFGKLTWNILMKYGGEWGHGPRKALISFQLCCHLSSIMFSLSCNSWTEVWKKNSTLNSSI